MNNPAMEHSRTSLLCVFISLDSQIPRTRFAVIEYVRVYFLKKLPNLSKVTESFLYFHQQCYQGPSFSISSSILSIVCLF